MGDVIAGLEPGELVDVQRIVSFDTKVLVEGVASTSRRQVRRPLSRGELAALTRVRRATRTFDGDPMAFLLGAEAERSRIAHQFDTLLAVNASMVGSLPHQIEVPNTLAHDVGCWATWALDRRPCLGNPAVRGSGMQQTTLTELLKLPASERVEIALALWDSLTDAEREAELVLTSEQKAELDRRAADHLANPGSAISWDEVRRKLANGA